MAILEKKKVYDDILEQIDEIYLDKFFPAQK